MSLVILVEDSKPDAELVKTIIQDLDMGIEVMWFKNGVECLNYLAQGSLVGRSFSNDRKILMLMDLNMPRVNGLELLDVLAANADYKKIPKIIYTTSNSSQDMGMAYEKGALSYIIKPFDFDEVVITITSVMKYWFEIVTLRDIEIKNEFIK